VLCGSGNDPGKQTLLADAICVLIERTLDYKRVSNSGTQTQAARF